MTRPLTATLALAVLVPTLAAAQERQERRSPDRLDRQPMVRMWSGNRARLGITVQIQADSETDRHGAKIISVVEGGPADEAGIKAGDIITRFGSTNLGGVKPEDDDEGRSGPGLKLVELAQELDEGDTVRVNYRRDGQAGTATIVAGEVNTYTFRHFDGPDVLMPRMEGGNFTFSREPFGGVHLNQGPDGFTFFLGNRGIHMIPMNADLGEYFGTTEGLLIAQVHDSSLPFRSGDVLLSIDGRKPSSVAHAMRIIGSYDEGETVRAEVMRKRQRVNVEWKVEQPARVQGTVRPSRRSLERTPRRSEERTRM